jgi:hypothetical protein
MSGFNLVQFVWDRSALQPNEDVAVNAIHVRGITNNLPDIFQIDDIRRQEFVTDVGDFMDAIQSYISAKCELRELRFYDVPDTPGADMGDPAMVAPINRPGTGSGLPLPPQVSISVTFRTAQRKRWGRMYLPCPTTSWLTPDGRLDTAACTAIANAATFLTNRAQTGCALTVFSRTLWSHFDPETIQVDDVYDIIRRRRFSQPTFRAQVPAS